MNWNLHIPIKDLPEALGKIVLIGMACLLLIITIVSTSGSVKFSGPLTEQTECGESEADEQFKEGKEILQNLFVQYHDHDYCLKHSMAKRNCQNGELQWVNTASEVHTPPPEL